MSNKGTDFQAAIAGLNKNAAIQNDKQFNQPSHKDRHETAYTKILDAYADDIKKTLKKKSRYKSLVFWLAYALLAGVFIFFVVLLWKKPLSDLTEWCSVVLPAMVSFLTVFFVIPKVITEYLFNSEEEKYMSEIIKNIQNYDKDNSE